MNKQDVETTGKNYVYIEILRQVSPDQPYSEFEYFLLGGFDAMKIGLEENIGALKKRFEKGQESTPELFDRQPLFLYTSQNMAEIDSENSIFYRYGEYAARPLIVTLFQLDKFRLARNEEIQTPELLINAFAKLVETEMSEQGITEDRIEYQVFWNLGESDVVTIFRPSTLNILAQILHALRMKENADSQQPIRIISTSSHCAFPKPDITEKMRKKEIRDIFRKHLKIWLYKEFENISQEFLTLVNISENGITYTVIKRRRNKNLFLL